MKITNFRNLICTNGLKPFSYCEFAEVTVETGCLWWKKFTTVTVFKEQYLSHWRFVDTGNYTPGRVVENMYASYIAKLRLKDEIERIPPKTK